jgi:hypothetical protein
VWRWGGRFPSVTVERPGTCRFPVLRWSGWHLPVPGVAGTRQVPGVAVEDVHDW